MSVKNKKKKYPKIPLAILHVGANVNNTILTLTDQHGNCLAQVSSGSCGFKHCRKSTPHATYTAIRNMLEKASSLFSVKEIILKISGPGIARDMIQLFQNNNISILSVEDNTNPPHNGVRLRRERRL
jgi:small subunit ribosomal protein S11